jgi:hypothetical protein
MYGCNLLLSVNRSLGKSTCFTCSKVGVSNHSKESQTERQLLSSLLTISATAIAVLSSGTDSCFRAFFCSIKLGSMRSAFALALGCSQPSLMSVNQLDVILSSLVVAYPPHQRASSSLHRLLANLTIP